MNSPMNLKFVCVSDSISSIQQHIIEIIHNLLQHVTITENQHSIHIIDERMNTQLIAITLSTDDANRVDGLYNIYVHFTSTENMLCIRVYHLIYKEISQKKELYVRQIQM
jgi:hypothetical protein